MKNKQLGISFIGVLFVVGVFAFIGVIAAQALPDDDGVPDHYQSRQQGCG